MEGKSGCLGGVGFQSGHPGQRLDEVLLHLFTSYDGVEEAMLEQELGALEALGKLLADGLLDDARGRRSRSELRALRC